MKISFKQLILYFYYFTFSVYLDDIQLIHFSPLNLKLLHTGVEWADATPPALRAAC